MIGLAGPSSHSSPARPTDRKPRDRSTPLSPPSPAIQRGGKRSRPLQPAPHQTNPSHMPPSKRLNQAPPLFSPFPCHPPPTPHPSPLGAARTTHMHPALVVCFGSSRPRGKGEEGEKGKSRKKDERAKKGPLISRAAGAVLHRIHYRLQWKKETNAPRSQIGIYDDEKPPPSPLCLLRRSMVEVVVVVMVVVVAGRGPPAPQRLHARLRCDADGGRNDDTCVWLG